MKLSKAVLLASGIGVSSQFSFGSISVSNQGPTDTDFKIFFRIWLLAERAGRSKFIISFKMVKNANVNAVEVMLHHLHHLNGNYFS